MNKLDEFMATEIKRVGFAYENGFILTLNPTPYYTNDSMETWEPWSPSTNMNQAMECVIEFEKTEPKKIGFKLWYNDTCDMWVCEMNYDFICVYDSSPAKAICRALAKAKGFKDE